MSTNTEPRTAIEFTTWKTGRGYSEGLHHAVPVYCNEATSGHKLPCEVYADGQDTATELAAELVRRWNAYPELVAALSDFVAMWEGMANAKGTPGLLLMREYEQARAALARARGVK